mgnify:CR=1 FL=1
MNKYWTTTSTGLNTEWTTSSSYENISIKYLIKK